MAAGSVTNPEKAYHLELAVLSEELAGQIREIISSFMIDAKIARRKKYYVVYIKESSPTLSSINTVASFSLPFIH